VSEEGKATKQIADRNRERSSGVTGVREFRRKTASEDVPSALLNSRTPVTPELLS